MDAHRSLKLRRSDRSQTLLQLHEEQKSVKIDHIREILTQNFLRRFGKPGESPNSKDRDMKSLFESNKVINEEIAKFLKQNSNSIKSKDLQHFERELAKLLGWERQPQNEKSFVRISIPEVKHNQIIRKVDSLPRLKTVSTPLPQNQLQRRGDFSNQSVSKLETLKNKVFNLEDEKQNNAYANLKKTQGLNRVHTQSSLAEKNKQDVQQLKIEIVKRQDSLNSERFQPFMYENKSRLLPKIVGKVREEIIDDMPSQISVDEWGEVQKYGKILDLEAKLKEKESYINKQRLVKQTLDVQVQEQMKLKEQKQKEKIEYDQFVIENDRNDLYLEKQKRDALQIKVLEAKKMRDEMVQDAKKKRNEMEMVMRTQEHLQVLELQKQLQNEKQQIKLKRDQEREQARLVILENEIEKKKRMQQQYELKQKDAKEILDEINAKEREQLKREQEIKERDEKIQKIMAKMGDVVSGNKDKELIRKAERDYIEQCLQKDEQSRQQDLQIKVQKRKMNIEVKNYLECQVIEKKQKVASDLELNKVYVQQVREKDQEVQRQELEKIAKNKQDAMAHAEYIKSQMTKPIPLGHDAHIYKKHLLGGMMNAEEARMNKGLLQEIARKRLQDNASPDSKFSQLL